MNPDTKIERDKISKILDFVIFNAQQSEHDFTHSRVDLAISDLEKDKDLFQAQAYRKVEKYIITLIKLEYEP